MGIKIAIIGAGNMAKEHIKAFTAAGAEISGIYSRTFSKAESLAAEFGIEKICSSIDELYNKTHADIVVITVNVLEITSVITKAAKYKWHIFTEKPAGKNLAESSQLLQLEAPIFVALNRRYLSSTIQAKAALPNTKRLIDITDQQDLIGAAKFHPPKVIANWAFANSIHLVDLTRYFARGILKKVTRIKKTPIFLQSHIEFNSGDEAIYSCHINQPARWSVNITADQKYELKPLEKLFINGAEIPTEEMGLKPGFLEQAKAVIVGNAPTLADSHQSMLLTSQIFED